MNAVNKNAVLSVTNLNHNLVGLLSLVCGLNKCASYRSKCQSNAYRLSASIISIINVMPMMITPKLMGKWHKLTSRPVGKVNI